MKKDNEDVRFNALIKLMLWSIFIVFIIIITTFGK